jgi:hypothetical protein|tara:strand:- start:4993 stop:5184 length:192 start_codon:yes stop_codon:yes gene_type:complete
MIRPSDVLRTSHTGPEAAAQRRRISRGAVAVQSSALAMVLNLMQTTRPNSWLRGPAVDAAKVR